MKKQLLFFLLSLLPAISKADNSGSCGDHLTWMYEEATQSLTISGSGSMNDYGFYGTLLAPWSEYKSLIQTINIGSEVNHIGDYTFYRFTALKTIDIPISVTSIGHSAFSDCTSLNSATIPHGITSIGGYAFSGCSDLTNINIPESVASIGDYAFSGCKKIAELVIPKSVSVIGFKAFSGCSGLLSIRVEEGNANYDSRNSCNAVIETTSNTLLTGCRNTVIPYGIVTIGDGAFFHCEQLQSLEMPETVTALGESAFTNCWKLTKLDISHMTEIGSNCFNSCSNLHFDALPEKLTIITDQSFSALQELVTVNIPGKVREIGKWAFFSDWYLTTVYIPESVEVLKRGAFSECIRLKDVYCYRKQVPTTDLELFVSEYDSSFSMTDLSKAVLHVPGVALDAYKTTKPWSDFGSIVPLDDSESAISQPIVNGDDGQLKYYSIDGRHLQSMRKGAINIIRTQDGRVRKIAVK